MPGYGQGRYYKNPDITADRLRNINLPEKIRCSRCNKWKAQSNYAKKRLNNVREKIYKNGPGNYTSECTTCVAAPVQELNCYVCEKYKGLEDFAKAQRKDPDHAKCNDCMKQQLATEPIEEGSTYHGEHMPNSDYEDSDDEEYGSLDPVPSTYSESTVGTATGNLIGHFDGLSFNDNPSSTASSTNDGFYSPFGTRTAANSSAAGGWSAVGSNAGRSASYAASVSAASTSTRGGYSSTSGFDKMSYGHPRAPPSIADSMETNRPASSTGGKWAKVRAYKPEPKQEPKEEEELWGEDESSSDDDEDSDDEVYK